MRRWIVPIFSILSLTLITQAQEVEPTEPPEKLPPPTQPSPPSIPAPVPGCGPHCAQPVRTVTIPKVTVVERQRAISVPALKIREVVTKHYAPVTEIKWKEEERVVKELVFKPRVVEQPVTYWDTVPVQEVDPCTGKLCTVHKKVQKVQMVKVTVQDKVYEDRVYKIKVPCFVKVMKEIRVKRCAVDEVTVPAIEKRCEVHEECHTVPVPNCPTCNKHP